MVSEVEGIGGTCVRTHSERLSHERPFDDFSLNEAVEDINGVSPAAYGSSGGCSGAPAPEPKFASAARSASGQSSRWTTPPYSLIWDRNYVCKHAPIGMLMRSSSASFDDQFFK
ncbi:hypothetical protein EVAR_61912_1 [Eumeta japonica]|uniref:Uncharacterized protein n=1 Tax=Eumeta variegata TaxID=151549 RepID=A0A4C1YMV5_EUMVA|nr:hypothetical protein EVAR_61912_1 [Eumeta japonica]